MQKWGLPWSGVQRPARAWFRTCLPTGLVRPRGFQEQGPPQPLPQPRTCSGTEHWRPLGK